MDIKDLLKDGSIEWIGKVSVLAHPEETGDARFEWVDGTIQLKWQETFNLPMEIVKGDTSGQLKPTAMFDALLSRHAQMLAPRLEKLKESLSIFDTFLTILDAMEEQGEFEKPITDHSVVSSLHFGGGSIMLEVWHFRALRDALTALEEK